MKWRTWRFLHVNDPEKIRLREATGGEATNLNEEKLFHDNPRRHRPIGKPQITPEEFDQLISADSRYFTQ